MINELTVISFCWLALTSIQDKLSAIQCDLDHRRWDLSETPGVNDLIRQYLPAPRQQAGCTDLIFSCRKPDIRCKNFALRLGLELLSVDMYAHRLTLALSYADLHLLEPRPGVLICASQTHFH